MKKIAPILIVLLFTKCSNLKYLNAYDGWKGKPKMVEISYYNVEKEFWYGKQLIYYDSKGRILKQPNINRAGNIVDGEKKFIYDKKGNIIEYIHYGKDSVIHRNRTYTYNKNGKILELPRSKNKKLKAFGGNEKIVKNYAKEHNLDLNNEKDLKKLTLYLDKIEDFSL